MKNSVKRELKKRLNPILIGTRFGQGSRLHELAITYCLNPILIGTRFGQRVPGYMNLQSHMSQSYSYWYSVRSYSMKITT